jgi:hypothetical protein
MKLRSYLDRILTPEEFNQLRLDPVGFVRILNQKLKSDGKANIQVDSSTHPPTLFEEN